MFMHLNSFVVFLNGTILLLLENYKSLSFWFHHWRLSSFEYSTSQWSNHHRFFFFLHILYYCCFTPCQVFLIDKKQLYWKVPKKFTKIHMMYATTAKKHKKKEKNKKKILPPSSWTRPINEIKKGHQSIAYKQLDTNYTEIWLSAYA